MTTEFDHLDIDALLHLSRTDAEYAGDMAEHARVLREMGGRLQDSVDLMRGVMTTLFGDSALDPQAPEDVESAVWTGESSGMMRTELLRLFAATESAPEVFEANAAAMDDFSSRVTTTLISIDGLHVKAKGGPAPEADTQEARRILQDAVTGYLETADGLPQPDFYPGLRQDAPDEPTGDWTRSYGAPAPTTPILEPGHDGATPPVTAAPPGTDSGPHLQGGVPQTTVPGPAPAPPPVQGTPLAPPPPTTVPPVIGARPNLPGPGAPTAPPPPRGVLPPVIGNRPPAPVPSPAVPPPGRTLPPVIGQRPGTPPPSTPAPIPRPGQPLPPVIGGRPGPVAPPPSAPPATQPPPPRPGVWPTTAVRPPLPGPGTGGHVPGGFRPIGVPAPPVNTGQTAPPGVARPVPAGTTGPGGIPVRPPVIGPWSARGGNRRGTGNRSGTQPGGPRFVMRATRISITPKFMTPTGQWLPTPPARPVVGRPMPGEVTMRPTASPTPAPSERMPGQRTRRRSWRGEAVAERAIGRGSWRRRRRDADGVPIGGKAGQEVFAAADTAQTAPEPANESDIEWFDDGNAVRPVIGRRGPGDHGGR
ncbi:hypothetical protein LX16_1352 [Stackebrandtia albiflava]|uniref:Uncharacterized protein n=1 Tax=Stackebrandtia albiflava TaxID=406432 RepID=A0A562VCU9_9ACTN|nr:hypothetical protein [Stackebrandtia albiflava]TWJ15641.1 hypothetical protein LX16_1352 [Stackebrandtia albiflava]